MPILKRRFNGIPMGAVVVSGVQPGPLANLSVGATSATTISVSYTAQGGTGPQTFTGWASPHGSSSWMQNAGTFATSGGSFIGLSSGVTYDLRVVVGNAFGTSVTDLLTGVTTQAQGAAAFSVSLSQASGRAGVAVSITLAPVSGSWPSGEVVTPSVTGLVGSFDNTSLVGAGSTPLVFTFTPLSGPGSSGKLSASAAGMVNSSGGQTYTIIATTATTSANRFDIVAGSSAISPGSPVPITVIPNANMPSGTITLAGTNGSFSRSTISLTAGSAAPISVTYTPASSGEHVIQASNTAALYNPYPASLTVFSTSSGTAQSIAVSLSRSDMTTFQRDVANGNPSGFSLSWAKGWGEVWLTVLSMASSTTGLWVRLYDASSNGASSSVGTGIALHSSPVQIYGVVSSTGTIRVLLPAGPYTYYADIATDAAFTFPVRIPQRFRVGVVIGHFSRSQESGLSRSYAYSGNVPLPTSYKKTATWVGFDYRYSDGDSGWFVHDGSTVDPYQYHYSESSSSGAQEIGRLIENQLGVCTGIAGNSATGGGLDSMVNHDGSLAGGFPGTMSAAVGNKFRYFWMATGGWDGVDSANFPSETPAENRTRFNAAVDWIARTYPSCAVVGWVAGASGFFGNDGSRLTGYTRNQLILLNEIEPSNPMVVSKECYSWNEYYQNHATMAARVQYVRAGFRLLMAAELSAFGGLESSSRGPRLSASGWIRSGSRVISIPYNLAGGTSLQAVGINCNNPNFTVGTATNVELASLFAVYQAGGYQGNGTAIKIDSAALNTNAGTIDLTLSGSTGIVLADSSTGPMPNSFTVHFAADFTASNATVALGSGRAVMITDDRVDTSNGIPHGWHMRPSLDIAISTI